MKPRKRYHRVYDREGFVKSIENIRNKKVVLAEGERKQDFWLKQDTDKYLKAITSSIQKMNKSKDLELFFRQVFEKIPAVSFLKVNGSGWKSDDGADLIVGVKASIGNYTGDHNDLGIVNDTERAIEKFKPSGAIMITTANSTERLENKIDDLRSNEDIDIPIELIAGEDVTKFVLKYAPELIFNLD